VVRLLFDALNDRRLEVISELVAPDFVRHDLADLFQGVRGPQGARDFVSTLLSALPDLRIEVYDLFGVDDRAVVRYEVRGTHIGADLLGATASGRAIVIGGMNIYRVVGEQIIESWQLWDGLGVYRSLGLLRRG
jgi:predicted ester cyclase